MASVQNYSFVVESEDFRRIDHFLQAKLPDVSRTYLQKLIASGHITVNDCEVRGSYKPRMGDEIEAVLPEPQQFHISPENIPIDIVHEDREIIVINKPAGMVTHPAPGHWTGTLVNALLHHVHDFRGISGLTRPGLVHRLDKDTSGLIVVAKSDKSLSFLVDQMKDRRIKREYTAFVWGHMPQSQGEIAAPIGRSLKDRKKMAVTEINSREAITKYESVENYEVASKLKLKLLTGRTHQIRVHLAHTGHPVIGDTDYGGREKILNGLFDQHRPLAVKILKTIDRQALHAYRIGFIHPESQLAISFKSELPNDIRKVEQLLDAGH